MGMFTKLSEHLDRQSNLMGGMMQRLDVDFEPASGVLLGQQLERAVRACMFCGHGDVCQAWQTAHTEGADSAPKFCPNAGQWAALKRR